jgi:hypothetical protein
MPAIIGLALVGLGVYAASRFLAREMTRVASVLDEAGPEAKPIEIRLERDPRTGVYRDPRLDRGQA